ncbi:MAG: hypothetical protein ACYDEJ_02125 [Desulfitobacteriaceae bacterium]
MQLFNNLLNFWRTVQKVLKIKDSVAASLFSGFLGTLVMDLSNTLFWSTRKTEALYGHIAGSIFMRPFRVNQRKNFWLGQITHLITGAAVAYPLTYIFKKTGKDYHLLKGAFYGTFAWEIIYGLGQRFKVFTIKPHLTKTHYAELFNIILYGLVTSQALVTFSEPTMFPDTQSKTMTQKRNNVQPIYSDMNSNVEKTLIM